MVHRLRMHAGRIRLIAALCGDVRRVWKMWRGDPSRGSETVNKHVSGASSCACQRTRFRAKSHVVALSAFRCAARFENKRVCCLVSGASHVCVLSRQTT